MDSLHHKFLQASFAKYRFKIGIQIFEDEFGACDVLKKGKNLDGSFNKEGKALQQGFIVLNLEFIGLDARKSANALLGAFCLRVGGGTPRRVDQPLQLSLPPL